MAKIKQYSSALAPILDGSLPVYNTERVADMTLEELSAYIELRVLQKTFPVGSIYSNGSVSTNPATLFGFGTWVPYASGRFEIGLYAADTDFNTIGKYGGNKFHRHALNNAIAAIMSGYGKFRYLVNSWTATNSHTMSIPGGASNTNNGGVAIEGETDFTSDVSQVPPYLVSAKWIRTA